MRNKIELQKFLAKRSDATQERQEAHELLELLPDGKVPAVRSLLEVMVEPLSRSLASASVEEEEITSDTATALERARSSLARGEGIPHEEILREFSSPPGYRPWSRRRHSSRRNPA